MFLASVLPGVACGLLLSRAVLAKPLSHPRTAGLPARATPCGEHGPTNRQCWKDHWDIYTDHELFTPTGITRSFELTITNETLVSPDGGPPTRAFLVNGVFPGPPIIADWGDTLEVTIHNQLADNGTSIHWHGFRQHNSVEQDGVNGVTECPIPPGGSKTYKFVAAQYGTGWYHSHFSSQYGDGVLGAMQINGPVSANYDIDLGAYPISDWYYSTSTLIHLQTEQVVGLPPPSDNILFNGTNINPRGSGGAYSRVKLTPGKKHLLRLINMSVENSFIVSLVGHKFIVVATDLVPVQPVVKDQLFLGVGQRYDVIIDASQRVDSYWFNASLGASTTCGRSANTQAAAIFSYDGAGQGVPSDPGPAFPATCDETTGFTPVLIRDASREEFMAHEHMLDVDLSSTVISRGNVYRWTVNRHMIDVQWDKPTLMYVAEGNSTFPPNANVITLEEEGAWIYFIIDNLEGTFPHPVHLHGHSFLVLGSSPTGPFNLDTDIAQLQFSNPIRRDVVMLPTGWLVIGFQVDNPGAWLLHCHIAWHVGQGLGVQLLELPEKIPAVVDFSVLQPFCHDWSIYQSTASYDQIDSGL